VLRKITYVASVAAVGGLLLRRTGLWSSGAPLMELHGKWVAPAISSANGVAIARGGFGPPGHDALGLMLLVVDQSLERGFVADRIQVGVGLCRSAELLGHLDGVPEVIERVTCPAALALAAGEVEEQHGVLRIGCDHDA